MRSASQPKKEMHPMAGPRHISCAAAFSTARNCGHGLELGIDALACGDALFAFAASTFLHGACDFTFTADIYERYSLAGCCGHDRLARVVYFHASAEADVP